MMNKVLLGIAEIEAKVENNGNLRKRVSFGKSFGQVIEITLNCLPCAAETLSVLSAFRKTGYPEDAVKSKCFL